MLQWVFVGCGGQIHRFGHCGFVVVRFIGWLDFFFIIYFYFLVLWFVVMAGEATVEVVDVAVAVVFVGCG